MIGAAFGVPVLIRDTGKGYYVINDGHHRVKILEGLGATKVWCRIVSTDREPEFIDIKLLKHNEQ